MLEVRKDTCRVRSTTSCATTFGHHALERSPFQMGFAACAHHLLGDGAEATGESHYLEALVLALAEPRGMRPHVAHCHLGLGKLHRCRGDREQAHEQHHRGGDAT